MSENLEQKANAIVDLILDSVTETQKLRIKGCNWIDGGGQSNFSIDIGVVRIPLTSAKAKELEDRCGIEFVVQLSDAYRQG